MAGFSTAFAHDLLVQRFLDDGGYYYLSLHTGDPGPDGLQATDEVSYPGYTRVPLQRTSTGFIVNGATLELAQPAVFATAPDGETTARASFVCIGRDITGDGQIAVRIELAKPLPFGGGITPQINRLSISL